MLVILLLLFVFESILIPSSSLSFRSNFIKIKMSQEGNNIAVPNAKKARTALEELKDGKFVRKDSIYRNIVSDDHPDFKPEKGRYHLYVANGKLYF